MDQSARIASLDAQFTSFFARLPEAHISSPGRLELLGNHTDHNQGLVLVAAVDLDILASVGKRQEAVVDAHSAGFGAMTVDLRKMVPMAIEKGQSAAIIRGVAAGFVKRGYRVGGLNFVMDSSIFPGAGVSSSAAFELLIAEAFNYFYNDDKIDRVILAKIGQEAEVHFFGKPCGLLDQMGVALGGVNYIDFAARETPVYKHVNFRLPGYQVVLTNTGGSHAELTAYYKAIKDDMKAVASFFHKEVLREVPEADFYAHYDEIVRQLGRRAALRAIHFYRENKRVIHAFEALEKGRSDIFIAMVNASGNSSRLLLKNTDIGHPSREALSQGLSLSAQLLHQGAVRVHGGGFAGTMLAFVKEDQTAEYLAAMKARFGSSSALIVYPRDAGVHVF